MIDRKKFFDAVRKATYKGVISQQQVDGMGYILDEYERRGWKDLRHLAYILSTTVHETAFTFQPIREYGKGKGRKYGVPDPKTGHVYYGRGYVQLTWNYNYQKAGDKIGVDLYGNPDLALKHDNAAKVMFSGMEEGWFTGKKLSNYISGNKCDYYNARRIINGVDKAKTLEGYAKRFQKALEASTTTC